MKQTLNRHKAVEVLATSGGLGYIPFAPGTWGSLPGIPLAWAINEFSMNVTQNFGDPSIPLTWTFNLLFIVLLCFFSTFIIGRVEKLWATHDDKKIVIDETVGQVVTSIWFSFDLISLSLGFVLFRLFDIWKPGPIGWIDRSGKGAFSTLADDLVAGALAAVVLGGILQILS